VRHNVDAVPVLAAARNVIPSRQRFTYMPRRPSSAQRSGICAKTICAYLPRRFRNHHAQREGGGAQTDENGTRRRHARSYAAPVEEKGLAILPSVGIPGFILEFSLA